MGPNRADLDGRLLRAAAASHRRWFRERDHEWVLVDGDAEIDAVASADGVWSLRRDDRLGVRLVARGFDWGWRPHWMGVEIDAKPPVPIDFEVVPAAPPLAKTLPTGRKGRCPRVRSTSACGCERSSSGR